MNSLELHRSGFVRQESKPATGTKKTTKVANNRVLVGGGKEERRGVLNSLKREDFDCSESVGGKDSSYGGGGS